MFGLASSAACPALARGQGTEYPIGGSFEGITFESAGRAIRAIDYRPAGEGRRAAIVMMHGSGARITSRGPWHTLAVRFAGDGYRVLTPLFTDAEADDGFRPPQMMNRWRNVGRDAIEALIADGYAPERTGLFGYSLGSHVAVDGALGQSRAGAAVGLAGGTDVYLPRIPRRRVPVLVIRAENDTHVRPLNTALWVQFLRDNGINVTQRVIRDSDHLFSAEKWAEIHLVAADFFNENIGRPA